MCSVILSRTLDGVIGDFDHSESSLIGRHGYCTQELVNLLLTGKATSNCFDGNKTVGGVICKGITAKAEIGFLSHLECTFYISNHQSLLLTFLWRIELIYCVHFKFSR